MERKLDSALLGEDMENLEAIVGNNELIADIETPCFGYEKKLIIVKNAGILKKEGKRKNAEIAKFKEKLNTYILENIEIIGF